MPNSADTVREQAKNGGEAPERASDVPFSSRVFAAARDEEPGSKNPGDVSVLGPGTLFHGAYEIVRCIKSGGMGAVYEVLQTTTQRRRALKVMLPGLVADPEMRARFKLEATVAANIDSEHIVETLDAGVDEATGMPFIVMELLKGEELGKMVRERGRLSKGDVVKLFYQAALALDKTHAAGIVHRDLKPENLFVTKRDDGSLRLKILDFGVAKIVAETTVPANATRSVGSPLYMSPEQIRGDAGITPRADLYSLAHIAYTLLTGKAYWVSERRAMSGLYPFLLRVMEGASEPPSVRSKSVDFTGLPPAFDAWFKKAAALAPEQRFERATAMAAALADALSVPLPNASAGEDENKTMSLDLDLELLSPGDESGASAPRSAGRKESKYAAKGAPSERSLSSQAVPIAGEGAKRKRSVWVVAALLGVVAVAVLIFMSSQRTASSSNPGTNTAAAPEKKPDAPTKETGEAQASTGAVPAPSAAPQPSSETPAAGAAIAVSALPDATPTAVSPLPKPTAVPSAAVSAKKPETPKADPLNEY